MAVDANTITTADVVDYIIGGGGVDVGAPSYVVKYNRAPEVGDYIPNVGAIGGIAIGETVIVPVSNYWNIMAVAAGATVTTWPDQDLAPTACAAYVVTVEEEEITAVETWDGTLTQSTFSPEEYNVWTFDVPALEFNDDAFSGQVLYLYMH